MKRGFTLIEIVVVIGVVGILIAITSFSFSEFRKSRALIQSSDIVVSVLTEARSRTLASVDGSRYGVHILSDRVVLFGGDTYSTENASNELYYFESPVTLASIALAGGGSTILFDRLTGNTSNYGTITLQMNTTSRTITLLSSGIINQ
jgi:prepilin-type N-terminal cleavage/methylation domain-containing protein